MNTQEESHKEHGGREDHKEEQEVFISYLFVRLSIQLAYNNLFFFSL